MNCGSNPCNVTLTNTAACESLPSQIQNFSDQFFGTVVKTEIDGVVSWSLPCNLDVGLPNNPRAAGEGAGCYLLRLIEDGIIGLTGPAGANGAAGTNGNNAYTVSLQGFVQPTVGAPNLQLLTLYNPAILVGTNVFIATSGWYQVNAADSSGTLFLTLTQALSGATGTITAGKLVVPAGTPGQSVTGSPGLQGAPGTPGPQGAAGPEGAIGPAGPTGSAVTTINDFFSLAAGTDYLAQLVYAPVDFVADLAQVVLPSPGTYKIDAVVDIIGEAGVSGDTLSLKLDDLTAAVDVPGTEHEINFMSDGQREQLVLQSIYTVTAASQIRLMAQATAANVFTILAIRTTISYLKLA